MTTRGDQILDRTLAKVGGKGLFVKELETALADGRADIAVHSLKDVPMDLPAGFALAAVLEREDARDAWVSNRHATLAELPRAPSSARRACAASSSSLRCAPTCASSRCAATSTRACRKLDEGLYDAIVLAAAGLVRLGLAVAHPRLLRGSGRCCPAPARARSASRRAPTTPRLIERIAALAHRPTQLAVAAERAVSRALGGSCSMPLAAHATGAATRSSFDGAVGHPSRREAPLLRVAVDGAGRRRARRRGARHARGARRCSPPARRRTSPRPRA